LLIGPAAIMAAGTMGAGTTGSLVLDGAWFRYDLLWVLLLTMPLFVASVESASRVGLLNRNVGMFSLIRARLTAPVAWAIFIVLVPLHLLVSMGHMSVLTSSLLLLSGFQPPSAASPAGYSQQYRLGELLLTALCTAGILWMMASTGLQRLQKIMTMFVLLKVFCFFLVCVRGFREIGDILAGFVPSVPPDLPTSTGQPRSSVMSAIAMVGAVLSPPAMLGISYMTADDSAGSTPDLKKNLRSSIVNLGGLVGAYCLFIVVGSGFALFPLPNHADIDTIYGASNVLSRAFSPRLAFLGTGIFVVGLSMAAITTYVVVAQIMTYFALDMLKKPWHQTRDNKAFRWSVIGWIIVPGVLAPFWTLPELLKLLLLMGFNTVIVPLAIIVVILFSNSRQLMGPHAAGPLRNTLLACAFGVAVILAALQLPPLLHALFQ
jgi:manganese transport protein